MLDSIGEDHGFQIPRDDSSEEEQQEKEARDMGRPRILNYFTQVNLDRRDAEDFDSFKLACGAEAAYEGIIGDFPSVISEDQISQILPKLCSALRHGTPWCPAPLCCYFAPIGRITKLLELQQREAGLFVPTAAQVLQTCMSAVDYKAFTPCYIFHVYVDKHLMQDQQVFIRTDPSSKVLHSVNSLGMLAKKTRDYAGKWTDKKAAGGSSASGSGWQQPDPWTVWPQQPTPPDSGNKWVASTKDKKESWDERPTEDAWANWNKKW